MATAAAGDKQPRRQKRRAEDELEDEQPLAKRFGFLNIDRSSQPLSTGSLPSSSDNDGKRTTSFSGAGAGDTDGMQIDDTKTRVYINDLENEIAEIEKEEAKKKIRFMPEIERELMAVPTWLLLPRSSESNDNNTDRNQVILYQDPAYLSIPKELDSRKSGLIDTWQGSREKGLEKPSHNNASSPEKKAETPLPGLSGQPAKFTGPSTGQDADVMDLD